MKSLSIILLLVFHVLLYMNTYSQVPPAQGPLPTSLPSAGENQIRELGTFLFNNMVNQIFIDSVIPTINASIVANDPPIGITVSASIKPGKPNMGQTEYTDRPNERIIRLPYKIEYKLDLNNIPDRRLFQNVRLEISCPKWYTTAGDSIRISVVAEKPYLDGPSFTESAINFFVGSWLSPFIDSKIKQSLPAALRKNIEASLPFPRCNCMNVVADGTAANNYQNSFIQYQYKRPSRLDETVAFNTITVKLDSVRRLRAADASGASLYQPVENISVELFANHELQLFPAGPMSEGDVRTVSLNNMSLKKPGSNGSVVLIGNIVYENATRESNFLQFRVPQNFGNGKQKLIVRKFYWSKPIRLPNGSMSKPFKIYRNAYELIMTITVNNGGVVQ